MSDNKKTSPVEEGKQFGLFFELETIAYQGRKILYDVCEGVLSQKKISLTPVLFSRFFLDCSIDDGLSRFAALQDKSISTEKLSVDIKKQYRKRVTNSSNVINQSFIALLAKAKTEEINLGALTFLPEDSAKVMFNSLKLGESSKLVIVGDGSGMPPNRRDWQGLAETIRLSSRCCLALTTSAASLLSAMAANMQTAVLPDEFTMFQDFAGADMVEEKVNDLKTSKLLDLLRNRHGILN